MFNKFEATTTTTTTTAAAITSAESFFLKVGGARASMGDRGQILAEWMALFVYQSIGAPELLLKPTAFAVGCKKSESALIQTGRIVAAPTPDTHTHVHALFSKLLGNYFYSIQR